ncbi:hypothetical protein BDV95DRAFT_204083, partial [Massariosphaeria phaeospora]
EDPALPTRRAQCSRTEAHHASDEAKDIDNGSFRQEALPERTQLLNQIQGKIKEYNDLLIQHSTLCSRPRVPNRLIQSISNWFYNTSNAILDEEASYITHTHDLVQLVPKPATPLRQLLERSTRFRLSKLWKKKPPANSNHYFPHPETLHYASDARIDVFVGGTVLVLGMIMLIVPLWILAITQGTMERLGVITGFVVLFLALMAFSTGAGPVHCFAAAAAYSAVLVVFLQIAN